MIVLKKEDYENVCYNLPDVLDVNYTADIIYDGKAIIKYKEEISNQSNKYENWFFYAIYNTNFASNNSLCIS